MALKRPVYACGVGGSEAAVVDCLGVIIGLAPISILSEEARASRTNDNKRVEGLYAHLTALFDLEIDFLKVPRSLLIECKKGRLLNPLQDTQK